MRSPGPMRPPASTSLPSPGMSRSTTSVRMRWPAIMAPAVRSPIGGHASPRVPVGGHVTVGSMSGKANAFDAGAGRRAGPGHDADRRPDRSGQRQPPGCGLRSQPRRPRRGQYRRIGRCGADTRRQRGECPCRRHTGRRRGEQFRQWAGQRPWPLQFRRRRHAGGCKASRSPTSRSTAATAAARSRRRLCSAPARISISRLTPCHSGPSPWIARAMARSPRPEARSPSPPSRSPAASSPGPTRSMARAAPAMLRRSPISR